MRRVRPRPPRATPTARRSDDSSKALTVRASSRLEESAEAWKSNSTLTSSALPGPATHVHSHVQRTCGTLRFILTVSYYMYDRTVPANTVTLLFGRHNERVLFCASSTGVSVFHWAKAMLLDVVCGWGTSLIWCVIVTRGAADVLAL